jgi:hypothetical protein
MGGRGIAPAQASLGVSESLTHKKQNQQHEPTELLHSSFLKAYIRLNWECGWYECIIAHVPLAFHSYSTLERRTKYGSSSYWQHSYWSKLGATEDSVAFCAYGLRPSADWD